MIGWEEKKKKIFPPKRMIREKTAENNTLKGIPW